MTYCALAAGHPWHGPYHDQEYGWPRTEDNVLFERLSLEIFQAGLSWLLILQRRAGLRAAFDDFDLDTVAAYGEADVERLLADPRIIRNRRKVAAIIGNARVFQELRTEHGSVHAWLAAQHPLPLDEWVRRFRARLAFCGPEVVGEFLLSLGWLPGAHAADCPVGQAIRATNPPWVQAAGD